jgi:hypothetical protein
MKKLHKAVEFAKSIGFTNPTKGMLCYSVKNTLTFNLLPVDIQNRAKVNPSLWPKS